MDRNRLCELLKGLEAEVDLDLFSHATSNDSAILIAKQNIERNPAYNSAAARFLLDKIYREAVHPDHGLFQVDQERLLKRFRSHIVGGVKHGRFAPQMLAYDVELLTEAIDMERDLKFRYLGLQTLYDRYLKQKQGRRLETPQMFWMRVAMGLALNEGEARNERAIEFYGLLSRFEVISSTPTLFNSGTTHPQLSSCYLSTVEDSLEGIFKSYADNAQLSKWAGGLGIDVTPIRAIGSHIDGTGGESQGVIPFLKIYNDLLLSVDQCFDPKTQIYTNKGIKTLDIIDTSDLVLGVSGTYRSVSSVYQYKKETEMFALDVKHSVSPIIVTAGHPIYAIKNSPKNKSIKEVLKAIKKQRIEIDWVDVGHLKVGDFVAQSIPQEIVVVEDFGQDDARFYGILLGDGCLSKKKLEYSISGHIKKKKKHLDFVRTYLERKKIPYHETIRASCLNIKWAFSRGVVKNPKTGRVITRQEASLPFTREDLYDATDSKFIAPRFSHLPLDQTLCLIQGLIETDGNISRGTEITFCNTSASLIEGLRYQLLRLGIPSAGKFRQRSTPHILTRSDGSTSFIDNTSLSCELRIPAVRELARKVGCKSLTKYNWFKYGNQIFSRIRKITPHKKIPILFDLKVEGDESYTTTSCLVHNGGKRRGAGALYIEPWHLDVEDFIDLKKPTGDERRRAHDTHTALWIPDLFMERVEKGEQWTLFSPSDVPDLHDLHGKEFAAKYEQYEQKAKDGKIPNHRVIEAQKLWRKALGALYSFGGPWVTFKDESNRRSPQDHVGVVHSSNLCTEILLNTDKNSVSVCNLSSINLKEHLLQEGGRLRLPKDIQLLSNAAWVDKVDWQKIAESVKIAIRMLDNVIDLNYYPIPEAKNSNLQHRPVGLGQMGFLDLLYHCDLSYESPEAAQLADFTTEVISHAAIEASADLAEERGAYRTFKGSKWSRGLLPIDTVEKASNKSRLDWNEIREKIRKNGMRNSNCMAIAPTATIANIVGCSPSIEPLYKNLFVKTNLSGDFVVVNEYLFKDLSDRGLWSDDLLEQLKYHDGELGDITEIPADLKQKYKTAFEIDPSHLIQCASRRQKWIDMGQSLNLYVKEADGKKISDMYFLAWRLGLKTTYYLRTLGATSAEKSSVDINKFGIQPRWMKSKSASSDIKACNLEDGECESCQ